MRYGNLQFPEALQNLAANAGLEIPTDNKQNDYSELFAVMQAATEYYKKNLRSSPTAINYLKTRGITGEIAKQFAIGFAPDAWHEIENASANLARNNRNKHKKNLIDCGLLISKNNKTYDRFRKRIMFPIRNTRGDCIAFGGRVLDNNDQPKYLNSPETAIFHKGNVLYGLYEAKNMRISDYIVVEGYMDVVALTQHGIPGAVACLGTALSKQHINLLQRFGKKITLCFDGDNAGKRAAWRALETALPLMRSDVMINFLRLPDKHDPDSFVQKFGADKFLELVNSADNLTDSMFKYLGANNSLQDLTGRIKFTEDACKLCANIPQGLFRTGLIQEISQRSQIPLAEIEHSIANKPQQSRPSQPTQAENESPDDLKQIKIDPILAQLIAWTIHHPETIAIQHPILKSRYNNPTLRALQDCIQTARASERHSSGSLLASITNPELRAAVSQHIIRFQELRNTAPNEQWHALADSWQQRLLEADIKQLLSQGRERGLNQAEKSKLQKLIGLKQKTSHK